MNLSVYKENHFLNCMLPRVNSTNSKEFRVLKRISLKGKVGIRGPNGSLKCKVDFSSKFYWFGIQRFHNSK